MKTIKEWKRIIAYPFTSAINHYNRISKKGGMILRVPYFRNNYPSWTKDLATTVAVKTIHGFEIFCDVHDYIGRNIIIHNDWEPLIGKTINACVPPGGVCLDIGANIGFHTQIMSLAAGSHGRVYAF
jgi:hypothetical protein